MMRATLTLAMTLVATIAFSENGDDIHDIVTHHTADSNGVNIHYVSAGEGPVVLFVHGFPDYWYSWRNQMAALKDEYRVVAMDTRGYNKSDKPEGVENYAIELLLADVEAVIKDLGVENVTLVGHDWGGAIAWQFAIRNPERVNKLVICNLTHPRGYQNVRENATPEQKANTEYIRRFQDPNASKMFNATMLANMVAGMESDAVKARFQEAFENSNIDSMLNYYRAIWPVLESGGLAQDLPNLKMPVLQFHGLKDTAVDKDGLRDTWNWVDEDYTLVSIPSSGHWVQREAADIVSTTMRWWLAARP